NRSDRSVRRRRQLRILRALRRQRAHQQSQEERRRQRQERQQISRLGIRRGGELRQALLPRGQAFLRAQEGQDQQHRRHQSVTAQTGPRQLSHPEGGQAVRRNALLCLKTTAIRRA